MAIRGLAAEVSSISRMASSLSRPLTKRELVGDEAVIQNLIQIEDRTVAIAAMMSARVSKLIKIDSDEACPESEPGADMPTDEGVGRTLIGTGYRKNLGGITAAYTGSTEYGMTGFSNWGMKGLTRMYRNEYEVGYGAVYAVWVHEGVTNPKHTGPITYTKPGSGSHFLSNAFAKYATKFPKNLELEIQSAIQNVAKANVRTRPTAPLGLASPLRPGLPLPPRKK
jgi:hypothetical protein